MESLGWSKQKISIERERVDIALYPDVSRKKPIIGIETKNLHEGSFNAMNQILQYSKKEFLSEVKLLVVTDGLRYWVMERVDGAFIPCGYMNFMKLKHKNLAYPRCYGSLDVIRKLLA